MLKPFKSEPGRYVRPSKLWEAAEHKYGSGDDFYRNRLIDLLGKHAVAKNKMESLLNPLVELLRALVSIKLTKLTYLKLNEFDPAIFAGSETQEDAIGDYNDAIVNIFTRLNSAGRELTRQEITFAWIKTEWDAKLVGKTATDCFEDLLKSIQKEDASLTLGMDELVKGISAVWSVFWNNGELLSARDLLRGAIVRPMSGNLVSSWSVIVDAVTECCDLVEDSGLKFRQHYNSINAVTVLWCWYATAMKWKASASLSTTKKDGFEKRIAEILRTRVDRCIVLSQWAGVWSSSTDDAVARFAKNMAEDWKTIEETNDAEVVLEVLEKRIVDWIAAFRSRSSDFLKALQVDDRNLVSRYFTPLWLWNRLEQKRWQSSRILLSEEKRKIKKPKLEVDHLVAVKFWEDGEEPPELHALGNCSLLKKSFNIAKEKGAMKTFLLTVHEFKGGGQIVEDWKENLRISNPLYDPDGHREQILEAIKLRTEAIKSDLQAYISGQKDRVDLTSWSTHASSRP